MSDDPRARAVLRRWERLKGDRGTTESHWQSCANYMMPEWSSYTTQRTPGQRLMNWVFDETPLWALDQFANGIHGFATSTSVPWFTLQTGEGQLDNDYDCRAWLDAATTSLYTIFSSDRYNFATQAHEYYQGLGLIGTSVMAELESPRSGIVFSNRHMSECVVAENDDEEVDTVIRRWQFTAAQAHDRWGAAAGEGVVKALANDKPDDQFWFLQQVTPRKVRDTQRADAKHKAWESLYVAESGATVIAEGGFDEFPFLVSRFAKSPGEVYGRSPAMRMLPAVKMLNSMAKVLLQAAQKVVDPPLMLPDDGYVLPLRTTPGARIFYRAGLNPNARIMPLETHGNIPIGRELLNDYRQLILRGFYTDWFILPTDMQDPAGDGKHVTATFTMQQRQEKMRQASAFMARVQHEFTGPLIDRTFAIQWRKSKAMKFGPGSPFPAPPAKLRGVPLHPHYLSPLAVAQKSSELDSVSQVVRTAIGLAQIDPTVGQVVDAEAVLRLTGRDLNAPAGVLRSSAVLAAIRAEAAHKQQQQEDMQAAQAAAGTAKDGASAVQQLAQAQAQGAADGATQAGYGAQPPQALAA